MSARSAAGCFAGPAGRLGRHYGDCSYLAAGWSVLAALGPAGLTLAVHAAALGCGLSHLIGACMLRLRETYGTLALTAAAHFRAAGNQALLHAQTARGPAEPLGTARRQLPRVRAASLVVTSVLLSSLRRCSRWSFGRVS